MSYFKQISDGYILAVGTGAGGEEIAKAEYDQILAVIRAKPVKTETEDYRLRDDLTWEAHAVPPPESDPDVDDSEALQIILGGAL